MQDGLSTRWPVCAW